MAGCGSFWQSWGDPYVGINARVSPKGILSSPLFYILLYAKRRCRRLRHCILVTRITPATCFAKLPTSFHLRLENREMERVAAGRECAIWCTGQDLARLGLSRQPGEMLEYYALPPFRLSPPVLSCLSSLLLPDRRKRYWPPPDFEYHCRPYVVVVVVLVVVVTVSSLPASTPNSVCTGYIVPPGRQRECGI